jgi:hypothetical protein
MLRDESQAAVLQLERKTQLIGGFEYSGADFPMDSHAGADDPASNSVNRLEWNDLVHASRKARMMPNGRGLKLLGNALERFVEEARIATGKGCEGGDFFLGLKRN